MIQRCYIELMSNYKFMVNTDREITFEMSGISQNIRNS